MDPILLTLVLFAVITTVVLSGYYMFTAESAVSRRLGGITGDAGASAQRAAPRVSMVSRTFQAVGPYAFGGGDASITQTLSFAGFRSPNATLIFLGARMLASMGPTLLYVVPQIFAGKPLLPTVIRAVMLWGFLHILVTTMLKRRARRRVTIITRALPDSLDLMVVCLEAGLGLNATIARVGEERATLNDSLGDEFRQVSLEMRSGRSREDALRSLGARNGSDDLKALVALIIQSDRLGASMAQTLRSHADLLRTKRRQRAEEAARKLPIKMLFPLALLILPTIFVVTAGPAFIILKDLVKIIGKG
jgi:tight adherence protein C